MMDESVKGRRVKLIFTSDPYTRLLPGTEGTAQFIDSMGTVQVKWDDGSTLGMVPGQDQFEFIDE